MFELTGKVALITGGVGGIGLAIVNELLEKELKAVIIIDINEVLGTKVSEELKSKNGNCKILFVKADVRCKNNFEDAFKIAVKTFGQLDVVINCAAVLRDGMVEEAIDINYKGTVYGCLLALDHYLPKYKSESEAVILNFASTTGIEPLDTIPIYSSTKSAILGLTRSLGTDQHYQRTKVRVLAICPGLTNTSMLITNENSNLNPEYRTLHEASIKNTYRQPPSHVGKASLFVISQGGNGSTWIVSDNQPPYEHTFAKLA